MKYFIQIDSESNMVIGYSSSQMSDLDIEIDEENLEERFLALPFFYRFVEENGEFVFDEELYKEKVEMRRNRLTDTQKLGQQTSELEIELIAIKGALFQGGAATIPLSFRRSIKDDASDQVIKWKDRYDKKWATKEHIKILVDLGVLNSEDYLDITGEKIPGTIF